MMKKRELKENGSYVVSNEKKRKKKMKLHNAGTNWVETVTRDEWQWRLSSVNTIFRVFFLFFFLVSHFFYL